VEGPLEERPGPDLDPGGPERAAHATRGPELDPLLGADLTLHLPADLEDRDVDRGLDPGLLADDEGPAAKARALHVPIDAENAREGQLPLPLGADA
jgi:hypothetical protein